MVYLTNYITFLQKIQYAQKKCRPEAALSLYNFADDVGGLWVGVLVYKRNDLVQIALLHTRNATQVNPVDGFVLPFSFELIIGPDESTCPMFWVRFRITAVVYKVSAQWHVFKPVSL